MGSDTPFNEVRRQTRREQARLEVRRFGSRGFRGAGLVVAWCGQAIGVSEKYERVEGADKTPVASLSS